MQIAVYMINWKMVVNVVLIQTTPEVDNRSYGISATIREAWLADSHQWIR